MRVAVIGSGIAGLTAAKHAIASCDPDGTPFKVVIFERASQLGGTWVYSEKIGNDEFGLPVHTSMYKSLRTNLPKEIMGFPDFPIPAHEKSYIPAEDMLAFLELYAANFNVTENIRFNHLVKLVRPIDDKWEITFKNLTTNEESKEIFDAVAVCNGHYHTPLFPDIKNRAIFKGEQLHSHDYRVPDPFTDKRVLIVGAGPSGMDLTLEIAKVAECVVLSHHLKEKPKTNFPKNVFQKPDVRELTENGVIFQDGSKEDFDLIFYCTGYRYQFPFLSDECDITVEGNYVQPLYKHMINIKRPTMCLIGLPFYVCASQMFDLQSRFFVKTLTQEIKLPSAKEMMCDTEKEMTERWARGYKIRQAHMMGPHQVSYYEDLAKSGNLDPIKPVMTKLHNESSKRFLDDLINFREDVYRIIDDETFIKIK